MKFNNIIKYLFIFVHSLIYQSWCTQFLNKYVETFKLHQKIYDFTEYANIKDVFKDKTLRLIKKLEKLTSFKYYIYILPESPLIEKKSSPTLFKKELTSALFSTNKVTDKTALFLFIFKKEEKCDYVKGSEIETNIDKIIEETNEKQIKIYSPSYFLYNVMNNIYKLLDDKSKYTNKKTFAKRIPIGNVIEMYRSQVIKSLIFLPFLFVICLYNCCFSKFQDSEENERDLNQFLKNLKVDCVQESKLIDEICIVCLEDFNHKSDINSKVKDETILLISNQTNKKTNILKFECNHYYHHNCIRKWIVKHNTCPTCRKKINRNSVNLLQIL